jgi:GDP-L-fucose synthase
MKKTDKILIVGHDDLIERALYAAFRKKGFANTLSAAHLKLDLLEQTRVREFFRKKKIGYVFLSATRSGGIAANVRYGGEFMYHNLVSQTNVIEAARRSGVKKLLFYGSSCVYPCQASRPMKEEDLLTGAVEKTSEPYAVAKIAGIKLCQAYRRQYKLQAIVAIPATVYGPGMDVDARQAHVLGALIRKFANAVRKKERSVVLWGSGRPKREFLYSDDFAGASLFLMEHYDGAEIIHIGSGAEVTIKELASLIADITHFQGNIKFDRTKPDGAMRKLLDSRRIRQLGWRPKVSLREGIRKTYEWYARAQRL